MITLAHLEKIMLKLPSRRIVAEEVPFSGLPKILKKRINREAFVGGGIEVVIKTSRPYTGKAHGSKKSLPYAGTTGYEIVTIGIKELIATAGVEKQAMDRATGGRHSWINIVTEALSDLEIDFENIMQISFLGAGNAYLADVASSVHGNGVMTVTCDNNYLNSMIENVSQIKVGMRIDILDAQGDVIEGAEGVTVTAVTPGNRNNGAATTGTFEFASVADLSAAIVDGCTVYVYDSHDTGLPMGLIGMCQDGVMYAGHPQQVRTFQTLDRTLHSCLKGRRYTATDFGLASENPEDGTPTYWSLRTLSDVWRDIHYGTGRGKPDLIICGDLVASAINRLNQAQNNVSVVVSTVAGTTQVAKGDSYATKWRAPDDSLLDIEIVECMPSNCAMMLTTEDLHYHPKGDFDFLREYGTVWEPQRDSRLTEYEAPYGGYCNLSADRTDNMALICDLRDDIQ